MAETAAIDAATKRLSQALDALEAAVERRHEADCGGQSLGAQLHAPVMSTCTICRFTAELDDVTARSREIETTNREIARRIDVAMDSIRAVIDGQERQ